MVIRWATVGASLWALSSHLLVKPPTKYCIFDALSKHQNDGPPVTSAAISREPEGVSTQTNISCVSEHSDEGNAVEVRTIPTSERCDLGPGKSVPLSSYMYVDEELKKRRLAILTHSTDGQTFGKAFFSAFPASSRLQGWLVGWLVWLSMRR